MEVDLYLSLSIEKLPIAFPSEFQTSMLKACHDAEGKNLIIRRLQSHNNVPHIQEES